MFTRLTFVALALVSHVVSASATSQFGLNTDRIISTCWTECHAIVISAVHNVYDDQLGNTEAITGNCADEPYITAMPTCLISRCKSAPDVAYAMEFGQRWCEKAGVDVRKTLVLPGQYVNVTAKEYFQSEAYLSSASTISNPSLLVAGLATTIGALASLVI